MLRENCRVCHQVLPQTPLFAYKNMPASAQSLPTKEQLEQDEAIELTIYQCEGCGLIQHNGAPVSYYKEVIRATAVSTEMTAYRKEQFQQWISDYQLNGKNILEIGCGRGEFIEIMQQYNVVVYGLEYGAESVAICRGKGLNVENGFVDQGFKHKKTPFDAFYILNFLEHLPDINDSLRAIAENLTDDAVGLIEVPNFDMMLRENLFSEIISDHIYYFTEKSLRNTLEFNGFEVVELNCTWHDYIISATVRKRKKYQLSGFITEQKRLTQDLHKFIERYPSKQVVVWGAGHQSLAVMSLCNLEEKIGYVVDSADFKQGKYTPATHIPILSPKTLNTSLVRAIIVIAGSYSEEVVATIKDEYSSGIDIAVVKPDGLHEV